MLIEGYASLFSVPDIVGDVVRPGAFQHSLTHEKRPLMLLEHQSSAVAGAWHEMHEDGLGLYVRGWINEHQKIGQTALRRIRTNGLSGLSIGFVAQNWRPAHENGRELIRLSLAEVSLVARPMADRARFRAVSEGQGTRLAA